MRKLFRFYPDFFMWVLSAIASILAMGVWAALYDGLSATGIGHAVWCGGFLAIGLAGGFLGVLLTMALRKKIRIHYPGNRALALILGVVIAFVAGFGGQIIYSIGLSTTTGDVDFVLLLDYSDSMIPYMEPSADAAKTLIDSMDENMCVQAVTFASRVIDKTALLPMDQPGKDKVKAFIDASDIVGGTNFDEAFREALDTLNKNASKNRAQAVIMLTDGDGSVDKQLQNRFVSAGIRVYSIRITDGSYVSGNAKELATFAENTGGFDTEVKLDAKYQIDETALLAAFEGAFEDATSLKWDEGSFLIDRDPTGFRKVAVRVVIALLYGLLLSWVYYGRLSIFNPIWSLVLAIIVMGNEEYARTAYECAAWYGLFLCPALAFFVKGDESHV